jgi:lysophospholipase L1-like esterase
MTLGLYYLAIGDSLTVGVGAPWRYSFVNRYRWLTQQHFKKPVFLVNAGMKGARTIDVLAGLQSDPRIRHLVRNADIITITAGGNDLLYAAEKFRFDRRIQDFHDALVQCHLHYRQILITIERIKAERPNRYIIRSVDLYNPIFQLPEADAIVRQFNHNILALQGPLFRVADVFPLFKGKERELLSFDRIHPNAWGYRLMADQVYHLGYSPLF